MASSEEDLEELEFVKETLKDLKEDILSKYDEVLEITRKQMEEINDKVRQNVEELMNKNNDGAELLVKTLCDDACARVKEIQKETEESLTMVWMTSASLLDSISKSTGQTPRVDFEEFVEKIVLYMETVLSELLDHLSLLVILILGEQQAIYENFKKEKNIKINSTSKYIGVLFIVFLICTEYASFYILNGN